MPKNQQNSQISMKRTRGAEEAAHTPEESILEKDKKDSSRNTYPLERGEYVPGSREPNAELVYPKFSPN
jgi:hypothetical protein